MNNLTNQDIIGFFNRFYELLKSESALLEQMLSLEKEKNILLSKKDSLAELEHSNNKLQVLIKKEDRIEETKLSQLKELSLLMNKDIKSLNDIMPYIPTSLKENYKNLWSKLSYIVKEINIVNECNEIIINDNLKIIEYGLSAFRDEKSLEINYKERDKPVSYRPIVINKVI